MARLAERFMEAQGAPIEVDGQVAQMAYDWDPLDGPAKLEVRIETGSDRPQGLRLKARDGDIVVADQVLDDVVLWSDTAPPVVTAELRPRSPKKPLKLRGWNVWRDEAGTMQAWIGDAGLVVETGEPGTVTLRCSDGYDEPSFDDLTARITLT